MEVDSERRLFSCNAIGSGSECEDLLAWYIRIISYHVDLEEKKE